MTQHAGEIDPARGRQAILRAAIRLLILLATLIPTIALAEVLDELMVFAERDDAVIRITFSTRIQYLRHTLVNRDVVEIYFQLLAPNPTVVTESRRIAPTATFPGVDVIYPLQVRQQQQRLTVSFSKPVTVRVRPGDNHAIDLIIPEAARLLARPPTPTVSSETVPAGELLSPEPAPATKPRLSEPAPAAEARPAEPAPALEARPVESKPAVAPQFAIRLETFGTPADMGRARPVPGEFSDYSVFSAPAERGGAQAQDLLLGFFATRDAAEQARLRLLQRFPAAAVVEFGERRQEIVSAPAGPVAPQPAPSAPQAREAAAPAPKPPVEPAPKATVASAPKPPGTPAPRDLPLPSAPPPASAEGPPPTAAAPVSAADIDPRAAELMARAHTALDAGNNENAIDQLNQVLMLPPNRYSQEAQELAGLARERSGEIAKARAEYELYLKLYPDGEGAKRVRERLAALSAPGAATALRRERAPSRTVSGAISQYYYGGRTKIDTAFNTPTTVDRSSFATTDQSSLVTNVDLTLRNRSADSDARIVFRDTNSLSFLQDQSSYNRVNAAFYDYRGLDNPLTARVGRQTGLSGGLPNRFDGALAGYGFGGKWRANAAAGTPVEYPSIDSSRQFLATSLDFEGLAERWSGNVFFIDQQVDGILDRRAVGAETRYFDAQRSLFSLVDYDTSYKVWNITMFQGTWQTEGRTTLNLLYDRRLAPILTTTNAIFGQNTTSVSALLQTRSTDQVRQMARDVTATATQALIGFTTPVTPTWQVGGDVRLTNVGALPSVVVNGVTIPAQPATGNIYSYDVQAIGTNLYSSRDTSVFSGTYLTGPAQTGRLISYNNLTLFEGRWTVEPSLRYYTQNDIQGVQLTRWTPGLRLSFRVREKIALESEMTWEKTRTTGPASRDDTQRGFFYIGYRWDL